MLRQEFETRLRDGLEIKHIRDIEEELTFLPRGYVDNWYASFSYTMDSMEARSANRVNISDVTRVMSLINRTPNVCLIISPEMTPILPGYYDVILDFVELSSDFGISAYIPKPYIDLPNKLKSCFDATVEFNKEELKKLMQWELKNPEIDFLQVLFANYADTDNLPLYERYYKQYQEAKIKFLREGQYINGFSCNIRHGIDMSDIFYNNMVKFLPTKDAIQLKSICSSNRKQIAKPSP